jgi:hypothetical protein
MIYDVAEVANGNGLGDGRGRTRICGNSSKEGLNK